MDLGALLNDRPAPEKRASAIQSEGSRGSVPLSTPSSAQNGLHSGGPYVLPRQPSGQQTPGFAPHSASQPQSRGLTPLHTPSQGSVGGQYPFPHQAPPLQSPASAHPGHPGHRSFEPQSATTPGPRPSSHGLSYAHASPAMGQYHAAVNAHATASLSPTPSSHHSQTSHSVRQSPLAPMASQLSHGLQQHHYHQSQPNTPLGPPQLPQRYSNGQLDVSSPNHSRTLSGASIGMMAGSPHQHGSINSIVESPSMHTRPSPEMRRTSDYRSSVDRERSVSVSPKTILPPRSSSHSSRHSSQQGSVPRPETSGHGHHQMSNHVQPVHSNQASDVSQAFLQARSPGSGPPVNGDSLSGPDKKLLQPQKMDMNHLLAPTQHAQDSTLTNGSYNYSTSSQANSSRQNPAAVMPNKRPAEQIEQEAQAPPSKRVKRSRRAMPIWASLHPNNPRYTGPPQETTQQQSHPETKGPAPAVIANADAAAITQPPSIANGNLKWEKSFRNMEPLDSMTKAITDHIWMTLDANQDIGHDPRQGVIEIEAKIGTLIDINTGRRYESPITSGGTIHPRLNKNFRFESEMNEAEHRNMNLFLNQQVQASHSEPNRVKIEYTHTRETDHFQSLNDEGQRALPETAQKRKAGRDIRLRTSISDKDGRVTARIVKIKIGEDLHIAGASDPYDVRISMNLEVNFADRADIDPNLIVKHDAAQNHSRKKDRLSYKHLDYAVDLTRVDSAGMPPKYELELEVDANQMRRQIAAEKAGQPSRLTDVMVGFVNNMTWLMRVPRAQ